MMGQIGNYLKKMYQVNNSDFWLSVLRIIVGVLWLFAGLEKLLEPAYLEKFTGTIGYFASKTPYPLYKDFLNGFVMSNWTLVAYVVAWGESIVGLLLVTGVFSRAALVFATFLNINFYLGAGWTGVSTAMLNIFMISIQIVLLLATGART